MHEGIVTVLLVSRAFAACESSGFAVLLVHFVYLLDIRIIILTKKISSISFF